MRSKKYNIEKRGVYPFFLITIIHFATAFVGENYSIPPTVTQDESNFGRVIAVLVGVAVDCVAVDADAAFPMIEADDIVFYAHDGGIEQALEVSIIVFATILVMYSFDVVFIG